MKKITFLYFFIISFFFKTQTIEKPLSSDDIKNLATEIFSQYLETVKKIYATSKPKPLLDEEILMKASIFTITSALSMWITYEAIQGGWLNLIRNIFIFKNSLKIDLLKKKYALPACLEGIKINEHKFFLFYGPPGTGKSFGASILIAQQDAIYKETDRSIFNAETYIGTDITKIKIFFNELEKLASENPNKKIVAIIDEFDSIGNRERTSQNDQSRIFLAVNFMLNKMDDI